MVILLSILMARNTMTERIVAKKTPKENIAAQHEHTVRNWWSVSFSQLSVCVCGLVCLSWVDKLAIIST